MVRFLMVLSVRHRVLTDPMKLLWHRHTTRVVHCIARENIFSARIDIFHSKNLWLFQPHDASGQLSVQNMHTIWLESNHLKIFLYPIMIYQTITAWKTPGKFNANRSLKRVYFNIFSTALCFTLSSSANLIIDHNPQLHIPIDSQLNQPATITLNPSHKPSVIENRYICIKCSYNWPNVKFFPSAR